MSTEDELKSWARLRGLTYREATRRLLAIAEGEDILGILEGLKRRYEEGMTPLELAQLDVLYSWVAYVFQYRQPEEWH